MMANAHDNHVGLHLFRFDQYLFSRISAHNLQVRTQSFGVRVLGELPGNRFKYLVGKEILAGSPMC